jgi:hypothetical protein
MLVSYPRTFLTDSQSVNRHLHRHQIDFRYKPPSEDPHELTNAQAQRRVDICTTLLQNPIDDRFWHRIVLNM